MERRNAREKWLTDKWRTVFALQLAYIANDFEKPHSAEFNP